MKAICVFSGGLDSMLAAHLIRDQGVDVLALFFETPFFRSKKAEKSARTMNLPFKVVDITQRHLGVVKQPKHGYGSNMNPCIDCHALMFRIAGEMLEEEGASFVFTGEVLGQRPMSQNKNALNLIAKESGLNRLLLRPLSAKCLTPTLPEEKGWIQRERLMGFQGRSRKSQMEMAQRVNISEYPSPAGGCLLTEKGFSGRLKDLLTSSINVEVRELELLRLGRHFRVGPHTKVVVGRNKGENDIIPSLAGKNDTILRSVSIPGPTVLLSGELSEDALDIAASITVAYSDTGDRDMMDVRIEEGALEGRVLSASVRDKGEFKRHMI
ncbi:MAG: tRNA 4-thiouridine(8) synthase ThiI [Proteobacteria bacterium]|nr:tRNA 4-thiouridine(8) synthase ThiI [Pseudomonadota bacterium]